MQLPARLQKNFKLTLTFILSGCGIVVIAPFAWMRFAQGNWRIGIVDILILLCLLCLMAYAWFTRKTNPVSVALAIIYSAGAIMVVYVRPYLALDWIFPVMVGNYFLLKTRPAVLINTLVLFALLPLAPKFPGFLQFPGAMASLLLVNVFAAIFSWMTENQRRRLIKLAHRDPLTCLGNRHSMSEAMERIMARVQRENLPASLILLDLDHFKAVNDAYGHRIGDRVLVRVANVLRRRLRRGNDEVFRFGGEEFLILLPGERLEQARHLAEELRKLVEASGQHPNITASFGCAELKEGEQWRQCISRADRKLYEAKEYGRNRVCI